MRSKNILLAAALALLTSISVPAGAQAAECQGAKLRWSFSPNTLCYYGGTHHIDNWAGNWIDPTPGFKAVVHFNLVPSRVYGPGRESLDNEEVNRLEIVKV
ncbi:hypothetical protein [Allokutzneria sp. NRRL B-24872]|uniref:hypothetical protein n=1 Tax=Allokutzneria sp. NRRL B-24872 TaxID=1137961 RepID=UPI000A3A3C5C|nr:hypothetical protein [Allokutzneria sp. NRRL B-24872]